MSLVSRPFGKSDTSHVREGESAAVELREDSTIQWTLHKLHQHTPNSLSDNMLILAVIVDLNALAECVYTLSACSDG